MPLSHKEKLRPFPLRRGLDHIQPDIDQTCPRPGAPGGRMERDDKTTQGVGLARALCMQMARTAVLWEEHWKVHPLISYIYDMDIQNLIPVYV